MTGAALSLFNSATGARVPQAPRNAFPGPGVHNLDARVSRFFTLHEGIGLQFFAEAFNVANHQNILSVNTSYSSYVAPAATQSRRAIPRHTRTGVSLLTREPRFGSASSTNSLLFGPRQMQFTAKFIF